MSLRESDGLPRDCSEEWTGFLGSLSDAQNLADPRQLMRLSHVIEGEIIPRLMMLHDSTASVASGSNGSIHASSGGPARRPVRVIDKQVVREFVDLLLRHDAQVAIDYVGRLRDTGVSLPEIYLDLLAPAARRLGVLWERDECDFTRVTIGTSRMHQVLLRLSDCFCDGNTRADGKTRTALIVPLPGEQHTFGLHMVCEFFRRGGWDACIGCPGSMEEVLKLVADKHFDVIGCSISAERNLQRLDEQIAALRKHSRNHDVKVLVGGRLFNTRPDLCSSIGADATARDGECAVRLAETLLNDA